MKLKNSNSDSIFKRMQSWFSKVKEKIHPNKWKAFPGDTYVQDLTKAAKASKSWLMFLYIAIICSAFADIGILHEQVAYAVGVPDVYTNGEDVLSFAEGWIITAVLVLCYIAVGFLIGKKAREYREFGERTSMLIFKCAVAIESVTLLVIGLIRYILNFALNVSSGPLPVWLDYFIQTLLLLFIMFLGAFLSMIVAYYGSNPIAERKRQLALSNFFNDSQNYREVFFNHTNNRAHEALLEEKEKNLDIAAVNILFRLGNITTKLNSVVNPEDIHDFQLVEQLATRAVYSDNSK